MINNLESNVCVSLTDHINGKEFYDKKVFVTSVVEKTPSKTPETDTADQDNVSVSDSESSEESDTEDPKTANKPPSTSLFSEFKEQGKRSALTSPEENSAKKNKKKKKKNPEIVAVRSSSRHGGQNLSKQ